MSALSELLEALRQNNTMPWAMKWAKDRTPDEVIRDAWWSCDRPMLMLDLLEAWGAKRPGEPLGLPTRLLGISVQEYEDAKRIRAHWACPLFSELLAEAPRAAARHREWLTIDKAITTAIVGPDITVKMRIG